MLYTGMQTSQISFPLGGIGTGSVGLGGNGRLLDWEIFNNANKNSLNGLTHFALRTERDGQVIDARVLHGDLPPPYTGIPQREGGFWGFGWGPRRETLCGMQHFRDHSFLGEFPLARVKLSDPDAPARAEILAWSPFIPSNSEDSSRPLAIFEITIENVSGATCDFALTGVLSNPFQTAEASNRVEKTGKLHQLLLSHGGDPRAQPYGELALTTDATEISYQEYLFRGGWCDMLEVYYYDLLQPGPFRNRQYESRTERTPTDTGLLAAHFRLAPGERKTTCFILSWHIPNRRGNFDHDADEQCWRERLVNHWLNYYATLQHSAAEGGVYAFEHFDRLRRDTFDFHDALFRSSLPPAVLDGVSANLSTLRTATCLRLEDGTFYGWEGLGSSWGSCQGSCSHVWNYAQALPFLFPDLERTLRDAQYLYNVDENGGAHFRLKLPLGRKAKVEDFRPCVDGAFGEVMKSYREWKISGRTDWLKRLYPIIKRTIEYAWSPRNYDRWDPERTGVLTGRQHNTLDVEFFGPSGYLNAHYLGALKAAAEMADTFGDTEFAELCRKLFHQGKEYTDRHLFNGEFYFQDVQLDDESQLTGYTDHGNAREGYWDEEHGQLKYQFGRGGCALDAPLAQFYATLYGLGEVLDPEQTRKNLDAIYRYNFRCMREFSNTWRNYCVNDEKGVILCTWPHAADRPVIPAPYSTETFHGQEWAYAAHLALCGRLDRATEVAAAIRSRYDGCKRNPWNEIECGSNYARSMASFALLPAFSGFQFDLTRGMIGFDPKLPGEVRYFWSVDGAWGEFRRTDTGLELALLYGELELRQLRVPGTWSRVEHNGEAVAFQLDDGVRFTPALKLGAGELLTLR